MTRAKRESKIDSAIQRMDVLFSDLPPQDLLIMAGGFIAGTQGFTPLSSLIRYGAESPSARIKEAKETAASKLSGDELARANSFLGILDFNNTISAFLPLGWLTQQVQGAGASQMTETINAIAGGDPVKQKNVRDYLLSTVAMGCIGMIEAFALTRPGTMAGIGEIVKGIGEIIPG